MAPRSRGAAGLVTSMIASWAPSSTYRRVPATATAVADVAASEPTMTGLLGVVTRMIWMLVLSAT